MAHLSRNLANAGSTSSRFPAYYSGPRQQTYTEAQAQGLPDKEKHAQTQNGGASVAGTPVARLRHTHSLRPDYGTTALTHFINSIPFPPQPFNRRSSLQADIVSPEAVGTRLQLLVLTKSTNQTTDQNPLVNSQATSSPTTVSSGPHEGRKRSVGP